MLMKAPALRRKQKRLQQQPFGHEAVEWRETRQGEHADQSQAGHPRHAMDQPAETARLR